jgi:hypothetical protein
MTALTAATSTKPTHIEELIAASNAALSVHPRCKPATCVPCSDNTVTRWLVMLGHKCGIHMAGRVPHHCHCLLTAANTLTAMYMYVYVCDVLRDFKHVAQW